MLWIEDRGVHQLIGHDYNDNDRDVELGRVEPSENRGFWHWSSSFCVAVGGADTLAGCKEQLLDELKGTQRLLSDNLGKR